MLVADYITRNSDELETTKGVDRACKWAKNDCAYEMMASFGLIPGCSRRRRIIRVTICSLCKVDGQRRCVRERAREGMNDTRAGERGSLWVVEGPGLALLVVPLGAPEGR